MPRKKDRLFSRYTLSIYRNLRYRATWLPGDTIELGSVGYINGGVFDQQGDLSEFGVDLSEKKRGNVSFVYQSSSGVKTIYKARGQASDVFQTIGRASGGARVEFSRPGAIVFSAPSCVIHSISNLRPLARQIWEHPDWERDYCVVTDVVVADSTTILVSGSSKASIELRASGDGPAGVASLSAGVKRTSNEDVEIEIVAQEGLTPLYLASRVEPPAHILRELRGRRHPTLKHRAPAKKAPAKKAPAKRAARRR